MEVCSWNLDLFSITIVIAELPTSFGTFLKQGSQSTILVIRNGSEFCCLLCPVTQELNVYSLSDRRCNHQFRHFIFVVYFAPVESRDYVATNKTSLVGRSVRGFHIVKGDSCVVVSSFKAIDSQERFRLHHCGSEAPCSNRLPRRNHRRKSSSTDKEDQQSNKHPCHPAHSSSFSGGYWNGRSSCRWYA